MRLPELQDLAETRLRKFYEGYQEHTKVYHFLKIFHLQHEASLEAFEESTRVVVSNGVISSISVKKNIEAN